MKKGILIGIAVLFCSFYCIADSVDDALNGFSQALQQSMNDLDAFSKGRCNQCKGSGTCSYCDGSDTLILQNAGHAMELENVLIVAVMETG